MAGDEVWGGLTAKSLQPMIERLLGITRNPAAKSTQQLAAVRVIIGFDRQQFGRAKEERSARRQPDPNVRARPIDSVVSPAMIEYLFHFLTSLIERPDISDRIAIAAGNLIHSLQRLVLAEQRWYRVQSTPKPTRERNSSRSTDVESPSSEPLSEVGRPTGMRSHRIRKTLIDRTSTTSIGMSSARIDLWTLPIGRPATSSMSLRLNRPLLRLRVADSRRSTSAANALATERRVFVILAKARIHLGVRVVACKKQSSRCKASVPCIGLVEHQRCPTEIVVLVSG